MKRKAICIVRVGVSLAEDRCRYQEMDFIVKTKYQEGSLRLLSELDNTEETMTGHNVPLYIPPRLSKYLSLLGRLTTEQWRGG